VLRAEIEVGCSGAGWRALDILLRRRAGAWSAIAAGGCGGLDAVFLEVAVCPGLDGGDGGRMRERAGLAVIRSIGPGRGATRQKETSSFKTAPHNAPTARSCLRSGQKRPPSNPTSLRSPMGQSGKHCAACSAVCRDGIDGAFASEFPASSYCCGDARLGTLLGRRAECSQACLLTPQPQNNAPLGSWHTGERAENLENRGRYLDSFMLAAVSVCLAFTPK